MYSIDSSAARRAAARAGCLPYTVGSTARTVPAGESTNPPSSYYIPDAVDLTGDSVSAPMRGTDSRAALWPGRQVRHRLSHSGLQRRRLHVQATTRRHPAPESPCGLVMTGGGFVNWGEHAETSSHYGVGTSDAGVVTPYGGLRVMQVFPMSRTLCTTRRQPAATWDAPALRRRRRESRARRLLRQVGAGHSPTNYIIVPGVPDATNQPHRSAPKATRPEARAALLDRRLL